MGMYTSLGTWYQDTFFSSLLLLKFIARLENKLLCTLYLKRN